MIRYSCHSENFASSTAEEAFALIHTLGFDCIDVSSRAHIPQKQILADPDSCAVQIAGLSAQYRLPLSELFLSAVEMDGHPVSPVSEYAKTRSFDLAFDTICRFAQKAGFQSIMGSAGAADPQLGYEKSFERAAAVLQKQTDIASQHGLAFHVEPSRLSLLHTTEGALRMSAAVPGLKYTLDFLHFHVQGIPLSESMKLIPFAGHLHARQAQLKTGKCDFFHGEIDYSAITAELIRQNWSGDIAMEFWCSPEMRREGIDPIEQNIVMRYVLKTLFHISSPRIQSSSTQTYLTHCLPPQL